MTRTELRQHVRELARAAQNAGQGAMLIAPEWILEATMEELAPRTVPNKDKVINHDPLVGAREVARGLHASLSWVYHHARHLPFARRDPLRPRALLFSSLGLAKYVAEMPK